ILRMRLARRRTPSPQSSTPQLLLTMERSCDPRSRRALMRTMGIPESPNPPHAMLAPSGMSATASAAVATVLSIPLIGALRSCSCLCSRSCLRFLSSEGFLCGRRDRGGAYLAEHDGVVVDVLNVTRRDRWQLLRPLCHIFG